MSAEQRAIDEAIRALGSKRAAELLATGLGQHVCDDIAKLLPDWLATAKREMIDFSEGSGIVSGVLVLLGVSFLLGANEDMSKEELMDVIGLFYDAHTEEMHRLRMKAKAS